MEAPDRHEIREIRAFALTQRLPQPSKTSWGSYDAVSIVMVKITTETGLVGVGEGLARFAPAAFVHLINDALAPRLMGRDASAIATHWNAMRRALSGRAGGVLVEALSAIDIALWDILGKAAGLPLYRLLGGTGRTAVPVYAASVGWADDAAADAAVDQFMARGFTRMKVKLGAPVDRACRRIERIRARAGDAITLSADANWAYSLDEAVTVAAALHANGYEWFEEPLRPEDEGGYRALKARTDVPLAAGESNFTLDEARGLVADGTLSVLQPNVTRSGGITETRRMAEFAAMHDVAYAPHNGMSGIVCEVASLHLAAALPNAAVMECALAPNAFRDGLADIAPGSARAAGGTLTCPEGPGLGLEIDWTRLAELAR
ncbi:mandelate racemase/muconate lactonizing enzyme family protein [Acuticoccus sp. MNP-M23]|uniref:mandelate racemase/muconate lactonizing enzyme family protein n=1 Tax=Acuticoccus sp. MNP-M23 TaxID=3072793 RepID=UPI0028157AC8|nr:mandelate racemase/muconate lactonizing enzyme family protein [Acuticoccus sp. MNP-M23]WMS42245.1 mandelate racemase/muconate lactonizing enzyme family protein [Acuticoccus sp. MNP-M23]